MIAGQKLSIPGLSDTVFAGEHSVSSLGYGFISVTQKLKLCYQGLRGKEIGALRCSGTTVTDAVEMASSCILFRYNG